MEKATHLISKYKHFIFDCDGVLWNQGEVIPGALEFLTYLKDNGKELFTTHYNSTMSRESTYEHAKTLGFADIKGITIEHFFTSSYAVAIQCHRVYGTKKAFVIGLDGIITELEKFGIEVVRVPEEMLSKSKINDDDFTKMQPDKTIDTVISGYFPFWTYHLLCYTSLLIRGGARYISTNIDNVYSTGVRNMPAGGSIMVLLSQASGIEPEFTGKPSKKFFDLLVSDQGLENEPNDSFIMIGDKLDTDIAFAKNCSIDSCLVLSGVTAESESDKMIEKLGIKPTYIANSVMDLIPQ